MPVTYPMDDVHQDRSDLAVREQEQESGRETYVCILCMYVLTSSAIHTWRGDYSTGWVGEGSKGFRHVALRFF